MAAVLDQDNRLLSIKTPLGDDVLVLQSFSARENISEPFAYQIEMLSSELHIAPADIVGKSVTISLTLADGSKRFFNGFVSQFVGGAMQTRELRRYRAEVVPWLWFLTRSTDCRIFQDKAVPNIIADVFHDLGFNDFETSLNGNHWKREYCVQYRESAFNFVSRLMQEEGIFYWFRHEDGKHTLVMADHAGVYKDCPENEIEYVPGSLAADHISEWEHHYEYRSGKIAQTDYNFKAPSTDLLTGTNTLVDLPDISKYELYDYPGEYAIKADGDELTKIRMEEEEASFDIVLCVSGCRTLHTTGRFSVAAHDCPAEEKKRYVITGVRHSASDYTQVVSDGSTSYQNSFTCIPAGVTFRPPRVTRKPEIRGPQTAVVVGPSGEEIYTDSDGFGQVKVQFHWDRYGKRDENSSCWVRVSQVHAGKGFGGIDIPRIGEEVIVEHLEGDPDQPIITGRVYNAENMPPNTLPDGKMISGLKSNSTPGGGGDNTIMLDDTKDNEKITIHAQYNMDTTVENDRSATVVSGNDTITVSAGTRTVTVNGNTSLTVEAGDRIVDVTGSYKLDTTDKVNIQAPSKITLTCGGSTIVMEPGKIEITAGGGATLVLDSNVSLKSRVGSEVALDAKAAMTGVAEAKVDAPRSVLSGIGSSVTADPSGVAVMGVKISLN